MPNEDLVELLDRQHARAASKSGAEFFPELKRYWDLLDDEPSLRELVDELRQEARGFEERFGEHDQELRPDLVELKSNLLERAPGAADEPGLTKPESQLGPHWDWLQSIANFDLLAEGSPDAWTQQQGFDCSASGLMLNILDDRLRHIRWWTGTGQNLTRSEQDLRPDLEDLQRRLGNLAGRHRHARQEMEQAIGTHGGFALEELAIYINEMNPPPQQIETDEDELAWANQEFKRAMSQLYVIGEAVRHPVGQQFNETQRRALDLYVERALPALDRAHEELRTRLVRAPAPAPAYPRRVRDWVASGWGAVVVSTLVGAVVTGVLTGQTDGLAALVFVAVAAALLPPLAAGGTLPDAPVNTFNAIFIVVAVAVMVLVTATLGIVAAFVAVVLLLGAFWLGQRTQDPRP